MTLALLAQLLLDDIFVDGPGLNVLIYIEPITRCQVE